MSFEDKYLAIIKKFLPSPFTIAIFLTALIFAIALIFNWKQDASITFNVFTIFNFWYDGLWNLKLLRFAFQMMLILVLGHVIALSRPFEAFIEFVLKYIHNTSSAAALVSFLSMMVALVNWGLGLVFGAILARKVGEYAAKNNIKINYALVGAAAYAGLMVWHGGLSGSAPLDIATPDHKLEEAIGIIPISSTIFSGMNIIISLVVVAVTSLVFFFLGKNNNDSDFQFDHLFSVSEQKEEKPEGAERLDHSPVLGTVIGVVFIIYGLYKGISIGDFFKVINLNYINFVLFGLAILAHGSIYSFLQKVDEAIRGASGILIQFPLYFGIMGIMSSSGMVKTLSDFFVSISTATTLPIFTFLSAGIVNIFIPSGGGQWAVQGPIMVEAAEALNVPYEKIVMALAYGDQLTNMLQPFWALPLLAITSLKAKDILPYSLIIMLVGALIFITGLLIF